ncbi:MAG: DUF3006 domain-containing protein [Gemmatimonadaceae bacterium]|nr:DUF3006 domain-containing protein [Gemmatimonadaceae bacterium]
MNPELVRWMVDALEENTAAVEQGAGIPHHIPRFLLPTGVREGDVCQVSTRRDSESSITITVTIDRGATDTAKKMSAAQLASTPRSKDPGGPIKL